MSVAIVSSYHPHREVLQNHLLAKTSSTPDNKQKAAVGNTVSNTRSRAPTNDKGSSKYSFIKEGGTAGKSSFLDEVLLENSLKHFISVGVSTSTNAL